MPRKQHSFSLTAEAEWMMTRKQKIHSWPTILYSTIWCDSRPRCSPRLHT